MPIVRHDEGFKPPKEPHLALLTAAGEEGNEQWMAIPPGANLAIIEDPTRMDGITPLILVKVSKTQMVFRCGCKRPDCTRVAKVPIKWAGQHPRTTRGVVEPK